MVQWWCWPGTVGNPRGKSCWPVAEVVCYMSNYQQTSSVTNMMSHLGWEELRIKRARIKTILLFKILNSLVEIPPEPFLIPTDAITRGHSFRFLQPHTRTITMQYSFFPIDTRSLGERR
jgi:hypothetical protein